MDKLMLSNLIPNIEQLAARQTARQDRRITTEARPATQTKMNDLNLDHYLGLELVGMVAFDSEKQQFVWLEAGLVDRNRENNPGLTEREQEILGLVAAGRSNGQIARDLVISENTVKVHLRHIFEKLDVQSRTEAAMLGVRRGWFVVA